MWYQLLNGNVFVGTTITAGSFISFQTPFTPISAINSLNNPAYHSLTSGLV